MGPIAVRDRIEGYTQVEVADYRLGGTISLRTRHDVCHQGLELSDLFGIGTVVSCRLLRHYN